MKGGDYLAAQQLDGTHDVGVVHVALVAVDVQVPGVQALDDVAELSGDRVGAADDYVVDVLKFLIGHAASEPSGAR